MTIKKGSEASHQRPPQAPREETNLDYRYGEIGILAVAAAMRYAGDGKNPADAPVAPRIDQRFIEFSV